MQSAKVEDDQALVYWNGSQAYHSDYATMIDWAYPTVDGGSFTDVVWKLSETLPADLEPADIAICNAKINEVKSRYGL